MSARPSILCIGVDVTWWGGSPKNRATQIETLVSARLDQPGSFTLEAVDLHGAPNPAGSDPTQPSFDADAGVLLGALREVIARHDAERVVVALDAPLEAESRPGQPPRRKVVGKGERAGSKRRQAEDHLQQHMSGLSTERGRAWNADLKIQAGSPVPGRIEALVRTLAAEGYVAYRGGEPSGKVLLEVFPSEAIWALGITGHYRNLSPAQVRAYKAKTSRSMSPDEALEVARAPLLGFASVLAGTQLERGRALGWVKRLAEHACEVARRKDGSVGKGKRFDDVIDSGSAFLTAVAFALGQAHVWGDGTDGVIVGPGRLSSAPDVKPSAPPLPVTIRQAIADDVEGLLPLQAEIHALHVDAEPHQYRHAPIEAVRERFAELLDDPDARIFVAEDAGVLLGYLVAHHARREHALATPRAFLLVDALVVSAKARRRGVGRRLMEAAMAHAHEIGAASVELTVRAFNHEAIAFYEDLGFAVDQLRMSVPPRPGAKPSG